MFVFWMAQLIFPFIICGQVQSAPTPESPCVFGVANVHFDNGFYYKNNEAYLNEINLMEERVSSVYKKIIDSNNVAFILIEYPVYYEQNLKYILTEGFDSLSKYIDTIKFPATINEIKRFKEIKNTYPSVKFRCIDVTETSDRAYFMSSLVYLLFSAHGNVDRRYCYSDHLGDVEYFEMWSNYNEILERLSESGINSRYYLLLKESLEVMFDDLSRKSKVKKLVENFKEFNQAYPFYLDSNVIRLINSYVGITRDFDELREEFLFNQVIAALNEAQGGDVLLEIGLWHLSRNEEDNLYAELTSAEKCIEVVKMFYPIYERLYSREERELYHNGEVGSFELSRGFFLNLPSK